MRHTSFGLLPTFCLISVTSLGAVMLAGCKAGVEPAALDEVVFDIDVSNPTPYVGEIVTFTVDTANTYGRDTEVRWETTGGMIVDRKEGGAIQVQFDESGEYIVNADLYVEGDRIRSDSAKVIVSKVR